MVKKCVELSQKKPGLQKGRFLTPFLDLTT
jgi:hypothetical protein